MEFVMGQEFVAVVVPNHFTSTALEREESLNSSAEPDLTIIDCVTLEWLCVLHKMPPAGWTNGL